MAMDILNRYQPVVTGTPPIGGARPAARRQPEEGPSFQEVLAGKLQGSGLTLSKHAAQRVQARGVQLSEENIARLGEGVRIAQERGLGDTLILIDSAAFLVSARNGTVITALGGEELKGNVFTNIDGTVVM